MAGRGISILCSAWALVAAPLGAAERVVVVPQAAALSDTSGASAARPEPPPVALGSAPAYRSAEGATAAAAPVPVYQPTRADPAATAFPAEPGEPTLAEVMAAAARVAAGTPEEDESRLSRARSAHWAPQLRAQAGRADSEAARAGLQSGAPLRWDQQGQVDTWSVSATWDLAQLIYDRDEGQLALGRVHLARRRHEVSLEAAERYLERQRLLRSLGAAPHDAATALLLLRCTAALEALTGGLFEGALARAQALALPRTNSGPSAGATPGLRNGPASNPESK